MQPAPIRARLAALSGQQRRCPRDGRAIRLAACPWDPRLHLVALGARSPGDTRGPRVYIASLRSWGGAHLASAYRRRWRAEQAIEDLLNGMDRDHLVGHRRHPNRVGIGFRLLARTLAIGLQVEDAGARPATIREPAAFRAAHVDGLGTFRPDSQDAHAIILSHPFGSAGLTYLLPWVAAPSASSPDRKL